jgi:DNA-directed RNA polymerase specialized sigma24 family protein
LPLPSREILDLRYRLSLSTKEIAHRLGQSEPSIRTSLSRLRKQLRLHLDQELQRSASLVESEAASLPLGLRS